MNELIIEIEEDIRRERAQKLWKSFGKLMVGVSIAIVIATIGIVVWQNHKETIANDRTTQFMRGLDRMNIEDYQGAVAVFSELGKDEQSPYYGLAMLRKAQAQQLLGDKEDALKTYEQLAGADKNADAKPAAGLGRILAAKTSGAVIEPVKGSPFYYSENEWKAWQLLEAGKTDDAAAIFTSLKDDLDAPGSMRERASEALQHIAPGKPNPTQPAEAKP